MSDAMTCHEERRSVIASSPEALFDHLDDPARFGRHMAKPSLMMLGGSMSYLLDEAKGRAVGSIIRMEGYVAGMKLSLEERVTERDPPWRKTWETIGSVRLVVIDWYRMGFVLAPDQDGSRISAFIDYTPNARFPLIAAPVARVYALWCLQQIVRAAQIGA